jgi:hypothetical protein
MDGDFLNFAAVPKFNEGEWIWVGKLYPITDTPLRSTLGTTAVTTDS